MYACMTPVGFDTSDKFENHWITVFFILYFFKLPSKSIISLFFGELSNIDYFFTFLGIDSQPWFQEVSAFS